MRVTAEPVLHDEAQLADAIDGLRVDRDPGDEQADDFLPLGVGQTVVEALPEFVY